MAVRVRPVNNVNRVTRKSNIEEGYKRKLSRCQVYNCYSGADTSIHTVRSSSNRELRNSWIKALRFSPFCKGTIYVCGNHFKDNDFAEFRDDRTKISLKRNAIPSINLPKDNSMIVVGDISHVVEELGGLVKENISETKVAGCDNSENPTKNIDNSDDIWNEQENSKTMDMAVDISNLGAVFDKLNREVINNVPETSVMREPILLVDVDLDMEEDLELSEEENKMFMVMEEESIRKYEDKCLQTETLKKYEDKCLQTNIAYDESLRKTTLIDMLKSDDMLDSWTGISTFSLLGKIANCVNKLSSAKATMKTFKASPEALIIIVMTRIKTNLTFKQIACLFGLTPDTTARYFHEFIPILKAVLSPAIFWPEKEQIKKNLPKCFVPKFTDCVGVMDCTEAPIEKLKSLESRIKTFSHYKGKHTIKFNVTGTPSGMISDLSSVWGGKASDKMIVCEDKALDKFSENDGLMVDKGYAIAEETAAKGITLYRPPILDKPQLTAEESVYNTAVAYCINQMFVQLLLL